MAEEKPAWKFDEAKYREVWARSRLIVASLEYGRAMLTHEKHQSDPSKNVGTGQALYTAEVRMREAVKELLTEHGPEVRLVETKAMDEMLEAGGFAEGFRRAGASDEQLGSEARAAEVALAETVARASMFFQQSKKKPSGAK